MKTVPPRSSKKRKTSALRRTSVSRRYSRQLPEIRRSEIVEAAIRCLNKGGASNLTTTQVMREAKVSRGLVNHYFPSMTDLLVAAYKAMLDGLSGTAKSDMRRRSEGSAMAVKAMIDVACSPLIFEKPHNQAWLEIWSVMPNMPDLRRLHSEIYRDYHRELVGAIERLAKVRRRKVDAAQLATSAIALVDGLWLNWSVDSRLFPAEEAKRAVYDLFEARLGPL